MNSHCSMNRWTHNDEIYECNEFCFGKDNFLKMFFHEFVYECVCVVAKRKTNGMEKGKEKHTKKH